MALLGSNITGEVGLRLLLCPLGSNIVVRTACCSVGIVLPIYRTFKAIERKDQDEQQRCLLYWAAYGSFSLLEVFSDRIISWLPFYYHLKFAFLVWLQFPSVDVSENSKRFSKWFSITCWLSCFLLRSIIFSLLFSCSSSFVFLFVLRLSSLFKILRWLDAT